MLAFIDRTGVGCRDDALMDGIHISDAGHNSLEVRGMGHHGAMWRSVNGVLRGILGVSLATTETILLAQGRWQEAIPLHLCSLSALAAFVLAGRMVQGLLDFLWYVGMPGALLALIFPAPAVSRWQVLFNLAYVCTHALILLIPCVALASGYRVRKGRGAKIFLVVQGIAAVAFVVNLKLGTDFLFLMAPPLGTPLEWVFAWGYPAYWLALEGLLGALLLLTGNVLPRLFPAWLQ